MTVPWIEELGWLLSGKQVWDDVSLLELFLYHDQQRDFEQCGKD